MKTYVFCLLIIFTVTGCKEKYLPAITSPLTGYLVVEGFISSSRQPTSITLSRTTRLFDSVKVIYEHNATVKIEGENLESFPLTESGNGVYVSSPLQLTGNQKYRLKITTSDNKEYASEFVAVKHTPAIDSISWQRNNSGLQIYVSTHDERNNTRYYQWKYEETWEIHSKYKSSLEYVYNPDGNLTGLGYRTIYGQEDTTIYKCWVSAASQNIIIGTSEKLSTDKIYFPIRPIEPASGKISILYSIHVRQYALSNESYIFLNKIKKNTEQVGSIFDAQPSELQGNIHGITDPAEVVVGYVDVTDEVEQRIFISNDQVPGWNYAEDCPLVIIGASVADINTSGLSLMPTVAHSLGPFGNIIDFYASYPYCVDCTTRGSNIKPGFWP